MKKQFRLKDKLKLEAVWALTSMNEVDYSRLEEGSTAHRRLKDAGVMHWFEETPRCGTVNVLSIEGEIVTLTHNQIKELCKQISD